MNKKNLKWEMNDKIKSSEVGFYSLLIGPSGNGRSIFNEIYDKYLESGWDSLTEHEQGILNRIKKIS